MSGFTPGPWTFDRWGNIQAGGDFLLVSGVSMPCGNHPKADEARANARLIAAAPSLYAEMVRFLPVLESAEADSELWARLTAGTGIATANAYRAALLSATGAAE